MMHRRCRRRFRPPRLVLPSSSSSTQSLQLCDASQRNANRRLDSPGPHEALLEHPCQTSHFLKNPGSGTDPHGGGMGQTGGSRGEDVDIKPQQNTTKNLRPHKPSPTPKTVTDDGLWGRFCKVRHVANLAINQPVGPKPSPMTDFGDGFEGTVLTWCCPVPVFLSEGKLARCGGMCV